MLIGLCTLSFGHGFSQDFFCEKDSLSTLHMKNYGIKSYKPRNGRDNALLLPDKINEIPQECPRISEKPIEQRRKEYLQEQRNIFYKRQTKLGEVS